MLGIKWLADHVIEQHINTDAACDVLQRLVMPGLMNADATSRHDTMLSIVRRPLVDGLLSLDCQEPKRPDVKALREKLSAQSDISRPEPAFTGGHYPVAGIRNSISVICYWSSHAVMAAEPSSYSYQDIQIAVNIHGAVTVLDAICEGVKSQTAAGLGDIALDVATTLIYASHIKQSLQHAIQEDASMPSQRFSQRLSLREALQLAVEEAPRQILKDGLKAETFIRLQRRLEMLLANAPAAVPGLQMSTEDLMGDIELNATMALGAESANGLDFTDAGDDIQQMALQTALNEQNDAAQAAGGSAMPSAEDDIFGDIKIDDDVMFEF